MKDQNINLLSRVIEEIDQYVFGKGCSITATVPSQIIANWYSRLIAIKVDEILSNRKETEKPDPVVNQVIDKLKERSRKGQEKYGRTLDKDPNSEDTLYWLNHFQEELLDACNYIQCLINNYEPKG